MRIQTALLVFFSICALNPALSLAKTPEEIRHAIEEVLMVRHPQDDASWWRGLGPEAGSLIIQMFEGTTHPYEKMRLLQALAWFDSPVAVEFLREQVRSTTDEGLRQAGLRTLGISQGMKAEEFISKYLGSADPQTRYAVLDALRKMNDPHAAALVESHLKQEKVGWIAGKLRGEKPRPGSGLHLVSTSDDRLDVRIKGDWEGLWIAPAPAPGTGMVAWPATLKTSFGKNDPQAVGGVLNLKNPAKPALRLELKGKGKTTHFEGTLGFGSGGEVWDVKGDFVERGGIPLMELRVLQKNGILLIRRAP